MVVRAQVPAVAQPLAKHLVGELWRAVGVDAVGIRERAGGGHIARVTLSGVTGIPETKLRVIAPDVGGGFGSKLNVYAEEALALAVARRLGRAVKWTETRSEGYVSTIHGRDQIQEIELAATAEGKITAVRTKLTAAWARTSSS